MLTQVVFIRKHFAIFRNEASMGLCHCLEKKVSKWKIELDWNPISLLSPQNIHFQIFTSLFNSLWKIITKADSHIRIHTHSIYICSGVPFSFYLNALLRYRNYYYCHHYFHASLNPFWVIDPNFQIGALTQHDTYNRKY